MDWCENNKDETFLTNVSATRFLTELAKKNNSKLIFISTDSVFDGKKGDYREDDSQNAVNVYSESKIEAEKIVNESSNSLILRGTFVGMKSVGKNESFFSYLLNQLKNENKIKVPNDKISNGLSVNDYSELLLADGQRWPTDIDNRLQAIEIEFKAGLGDDADAVYAKAPWVKSGVLAHVANMYANRGDCGDCGDSSGAYLPKVARHLYLQNRIENL